MMKIDKIIHSPEELSNYFEDLKRPEAIVEAQNNINNEIVEKKEQDYYPRVNLFFSFDMCVQQSWTTLAGVSPVTVIASEPCS